MRGFGVKDAERERFVALIEAAYADGQIGQADRDLRLDRARGAETRDELVTLTCDLRPVAGAPAAAPMARVPVRGPGLRARHAGGVLVGLSLFLVVVGGGVAGVVALFALAAGPSSETTFREDVTAAPATTIGFEVTPGQLRRFVGSYEERFGTTLAREVRVEPDGVTVRVPVPGGRSRSEVWSYDGSWRQEAASARDPAAMVDLGTLGSSGLAANVDATRSLLGPRGRLVQALLADRGAGPRITILVRSPSGATARLVTTLQGEVLDGPTRS
jgi:hypothetical protein